MEVAPEVRPYFSIVIPAYNREKEIRRAVDSCLEQSFKDIEVVIVDDGSVDRTVAVVNSIEDRRIILICHQKNQGVCPARNTGIEQCRGEWIIFLDSDDELVPGILERMWQDAIGCPDDIDQLGFLCQWDDGRILPEPVPADQIMDYVEFIKWSDNLILSDFFPCIRRRTFSTVKFAASRAYEESYLYDFTIRYKIHIIPILAVIKYTDSPNRITTMWGQEYTAKLLSGAKDQLEAMEYILTRHGESLYQYGPRYFRIYSKSQVFYSFLAGHRWTGSSLAIKYLEKYPGCLDGWVIWLAGLMGPRALASVKRWKYLWYNLKQEK